MKKFLCALALLYCGSVQALEVRNDINPEAANAALEGVALDAMKEYAKKIGASHFTLGDNAISHRYAKPFSKYEIEATLYAQNGEKITKKLRMAVEIVETES